MPDHCANPLFLKWLEELRDSAKEKGLRIGDTYAKACRSLAACPVQYDRPKELAVLAGIGPKTIDILEKKLKAHCEETGMPMPPEPATRRRRTDREQATDAGDDALPAPSPPKKRRVTKPRVYIPARNSGAYGLLIGLLLAVRDPATTIQVFLTKGELILAAQKYCDASYDHAERGTFVTAWAGMKTLVNKGYVYQSGSPHRFCLTEDGYDVAVTLRNMHPDFAELPKLKPIGTREGTAVSANAGASTSALGRRSALSRATSSSSLTMGPPAPGQAGQAKTGKFEFWYIDSKGKRVADLAAAAVRLDSDEFISLRKVEFRAAQRTHPIVSQLRLVDQDATRDESGELSLFAFIVEDSAPPVCSRFGVGAAAAAVPAAGPDSGAKSGSKRTASEASLAAGTLETSGTTTTTTTSLAPPAAVGRVAAPRGPRLSSQLPALGEKRQAPRFNLTEAITFPHGSYEIILVLDTREIESRASSRDKIADALTAKDVKVERRALRMGDICWIARRLDGSGGEEDECVLDYAVERKRLDDLCGSIRDGRYHEQSFRLSQSGIGNIFYVVEDWQVATRMEFHGRQIMTAKSQIQVINGFFLKETHKLTDTVDFLATMTHLIKRTHKDLHVIPSRFISRTSYVALQRTLRADHPARVFLTSFEAYQALNDKTASRTLHEVLARMLLCVKGMSAERVAAVLERWDTPRALYDAMKARNELGDIVQGRKRRTPAHMFADEVQGEGRRKIGDQLSLVLWKALWGESDVAGS